MSTLKSGTGGIEFLRSAWVEQREIESEYACLVEIAIHPSDRRGVWCYHFEAAGPVVSVGLFTPLARYEALYPNAQTVTLEGFLYAALIKLRKLVEEARGSDWDKSPLN